MVFQILNVNISFSYSVANIISNKGRPYSNGEFVKECLESVIEKWTERQRYSENLSLSR